MLETLSLYTPNDSLAFINALELSLAAVAFVMLTVYLAERTNGWRDLRGRMRRAFDPSFQGGPYDFVIACAVMFLGRVIRHEATWDWRVLDLELRPNQLMIGGIVTSIGVLCFIRIISPPRFFNVIWPIAAIAAVAFSFWSAR